MNFVAVALLAVAPAERRLDPLLRVAKAMLSAGRVIDKGASCAAVCADALASAARASDAKVLPLNTDVVNSATPSLARQSFDAS